MARKLHSAEDIQRVVNEFVRTGSYTEAGEVIGVTRQTASKIVKNNPKTLAIAQSEQRVLIQDFDKNEILKDVRKIATLGVKRLKELISSEDDIYKIAKGVELAIKIDLQLSDNETIEIDNKEAKFLKDVL